MLPLESSISPPLKAQGFRKKARTWWRNREDTIQVINLQKDPWGGGRLHINLGVYVRQLGSELNPASHNCHVQARLENVAAEMYWNTIASARSEPEPSPELLEALLTDGVSWLNRVSTVEGIRAYLESGGTKKGMVVASVRNHVGYQ